MNNIGGKIVVNVATAVDEHAAQQITVLTLDFDGVSLEALQAYAIRQIKIDLQRGWRKNGIPAEAAVAVKELTAGLKVQEPISVANTAARAKSMSSAEMAELVKILQSQIEADKKPKEEKKPEAAGLKK